MKSKHLSATEARKNFFKMIEDIVKKNNIVTITVDGKPKVVVMSYEDFEGWKETLEIMSDPKLMKQIRQAEKDYKKGDFYTWEEVKKNLNL